MDRVFQLNRRIILGAALVGGMAMLAPGGQPEAHAVPTPGITLNWDVALDVNPNEFLNSSLNHTNARRWQFANAPVPAADSFVAVSDATLAGITKAVKFPTNDAGAAATSFQGFGFVGTNPTNQNTSFEVVFRTQDLAGKHAIIETGGNGDGIALFLDGGSLVFQSQNGTGNRATATTSLGAVDTSQFIHAVGTLDLSTNTVNLYVNGALAATGSTGVAAADWAGTDGSGLGAVNAAISGAGAGYSTFNGDLALVRWYRDKTLSAGEANANYVFLQSPTAAAAVNYGAAQDANSTAGGWEELHGYYGPQALTLGAGVSHVGGAFRFTGAGGATGLSLQGLQGNPADQSATFELTFKPTDLIGNEVIWETGGGSNGTSFTLFGNELRFVVKSGADSAGLTHLLTPSDIDDFITVIGVVDVDNDVLRLIIDGKHIGEVAYTGGNWAGSDGLGLGGVNGIIGGTNSFFGDLSVAGAFVGDIASFRFYTNANAQGIVVPEPAAGLLGLMSLAALGLRRSRRIKALD